MKSFKSALTLVAIAAAMFAGAAQAAGEASLDISGTVATSCNVSVRPTAKATSLDILAGETDAVVGIELEVLVLDRRVVVKGRLERRPRSQRAAASHFGLQTRRDARSFSRDDFSFASCELGCLSLGQLDAHALALLRIKVRVDVDDAICLGLCVPALAVAVAFVVFVVRRNERFVFRVGLVVRVVRRRAPFVRVAALDFRVRVRLVHVVQELFHVVAVAVAVAFAVAFAFALGARGACRLGWLCRLRRL